MPTIANTSGYLIYDDDSKSMLALCLKRSDADQLVEGRPSIEKIYCKFQSTIELDENIFIEHQPEEGSGSDVN